MPYFTFFPVTQRLRRAFNGLATLVFGLAAMTILVSCAAYAPAGTSGASSDSQQAAQAVQPDAHLLIRKFKPKYESNISLRQYRQADEYVRVTAPSEMGAPFAFSTRYAQTEHMPLFAESNKPNSFSRTEKWGFLAFVAEFEQHAQILEGRFAKPAVPGDPFVEVVMRTEKLDEIGAAVGDRLILTHWDSHGEPRPIGVKIVGRWAPLDHSETYWFYDPEYFNEALMVPEHTYTNVILPRYRGIGYEYTWFATLKLDDRNTDAINTGIARIRSGLGAILGDVEVDFLPHPIERRGEERETTQ
ncbi:MAG: hypothetical protein OXM03_05790 [Chloroflexota bacterium]|nr:hypothetical protein [Chloroflexota bacterium]MDE2840123.1 hypothetical protein [Chloroflexota bacterium]MDE2929968.1 hypothetical protein [Chloroflexota bacterium]